MAYLPYEEEEDEQQPGQPGQATAAAPPSATPAMVGTQFTNPSTPDRFVNFSSYFNANKPAAEAAGTNLVNDLDGRASTAATQASTGAQDLTKQAQAATMTPPSAVGVGAPEEANAPKDLVGGTLISREEADTKAKSAYSGPKTADVEKYFMPLTEQAGRVSREINTAQDAAGIQALKGGSSF